MVSQRKILRCVLSAALIAAACAHAVADGAAEAMSWQIDGAKRRALVYLPAAKSPGGKAPLVFSFHGHGDNIVNFQRTNMHRAWPEAIVVYFQGLTTGGDPLPGWQTQRGQNGDRDLKLVDAALASLRTKYDVDERRVYATGFSNGAIFTYLLWAERPRVFAAFAPVAGRLAASVQPAEPRPIFHVAGELDGRISITSQEEAIAAARRIDRAADAGVPCGEGCTVYGADSPTPVMAWLHPGGHEYPETTSLRIARFFREHQLPK
jgi:polyhydroxybutyrate depolymerase